MIQEASFVTIDATSTKDIDDAIAASKTPGGYQLLVAIADPTGVVPLGSPMDHRARQRAATVYARDTATQRMLPSEVSEESCSLIAGRERSAFVFEIHLGDDLEPRDFKAHAHTITVAQRLSYQDVPGIIAATTHPQHEQIKLVSQLADRLLASRRARGALAWYDLQQMLVADEEGRLRKFASREETIGHVVVQEVMVLANSLLARYLAQENVPAIYRNHVAYLAAPPQITLLGAIESLALTGDLGLVEAKLQTVARRVRYEGVATGHYGLNLPAYMHGTSPLRRYADLVSLRQLKAHLAGAELPYTQAEVAEIAEEISTTLDARRDAVRAGYKAAVEQKAKARIDAGRAQQLDDPQLSMAVKTVREDGVLPRALCLELIRRMAAGVLSDGVADRLLFGIERSAIPDDVAQAASAWLFANPHKGMHFVNFASQAGRMTGLSVTATPAGGKFKAVAVATALPEGRECRGESIAQRKKDAEHQAVCRVVVVAAGLPMPSVSDTAVSKTVQFSRSVEPSRISSRFARSVE